MAHARLSRPRLASFWLGTFAVSAISAACGGSTPAAVTAPGSSAPVTVPAPDLTEVPEPKDLVLVARWADPEASANAASGFTGLPISLSELTEKLPAWLAPLTATNAPADFVLTLAEGRATSEPSFHGAVAIGLRTPVEEARRSALDGGEQIEELGPGVYRLEGELADLRCTLAASVGPAPTRLVCGENADDVDLLAPYLTRTLPKQAPATSDLAVELRFVPFEKRYSSTIQQGVRMGASVLPSQFHLGQPRFDRALTDAVYGLADEAIALTHDLNTLSLGLGFKKEAAKGSFSLDFRGSQSWTVQTLNDAGTRAAAAPPSFWALPLDSTAASFGRGASSARFTGIRHTLSALLDGWLAHEGVKPADRQALVELLSDEYATDAVSVAASGPYDAQTRAAILGTDKAPRAAALRNAIASAGWHLIGFEEPAEKWAGALRKLVAAYNGAGVQKQIERGLKALDVEMPAPQVKLAKASKDLPEGSLELSVTVYPDATKAAKPGPAVKLSAFLMPDAGRTWVAVGADRASLIARLRSVKAGAPESGTLAARPGLEGLKSGAFTSAGFMTAASLLQSLEGKAGDALAELGAGGLDSNRILSAMPNAGQTPIVFETSVHDQGSATGAGMQLVAPKAAIEDIVAGVMHVAASKLGSAIGSSK